MPAKNDYAVQQLHRSAWFAGKPAPTQASSYRDRVIFVRMSNAPLTRRVFFRIRFTPYEGSHLENHP